MYRSEAQYKSFFKKSVSKEGGFSLSLSSPNFAGTPDLYVALPNYVPTMLEAKRIRKHSYIIKTTPIQKRMLDEINSACKNSAFVVVFFPYGENEDEYAALVPATTTHLSKRDIEMAVPLAKDKTFNVCALFTNAGVTECRQSQQTVANN